MTRMREGECVMVTSRDRYRRTAICDISPSREMGRPALFTVMIYAQPVTWASC